MKPLLRLSQPTFWPLQLGGWLTYAVIYLVSAIPDRDFGQVLLDREAAIAILFLFSLYLRVCYRQWIAAGISSAHFVRRAVPLCLLAGAVSASIAHGLQLMVAPASQALSLCLFNCVLWGALQAASWSALYFGIKHNQVLQVEREQTLLAKSHARAAQLQALRYQLNPHFLFNTLNSISTLVREGQGRRANLMLSQLSTFLRARLESEINEISLEQELSTIRDYLAIEQTRLEERLTVSYQIAPEAQGGLLPVMILQPLVENAIVHGVLPYACPSTIEIRAARLAERLHLTVWNSLPPTSLDTAEPCGTGIGLRNIRQRLLEVYGPEASLSVRSNERAGEWEATLELPFVAAPLEAALPEPEPEFDYAA